MPQRRFSPAAWLAPLVVALVLGCVAAYFLLVPLARGYQCVSSSGHSVCGTKIYP